MAKIRSVAYYLGAAGVGAAAQFEMEGDVPLILWVVAVTFLLAGIFTTGSPRKQASSRQ